MPVTVDRGTGTTQPPAQTPRDRPRRRGSVPSWTTAERRTAHPGGAAWPSGGEAGHGGIRSGWRTRGAWGAGPGPRRVERAGRWSFGPGGIDHRDGRLCRRRRASGNHARAPPGRARAGARRVARERRPRVRAERPVARARRDGGHAVLPAPRDAHPPAGWVQPVMGRCLRPRGTRGAGGAAVAGARRLAHLCRVPRRLQSRGHRVVRRGRGPAGSQPRSTRRAPERLAARRGRDRAAPRPVLPAAAVRRRVPRRADAQRARDDPPPRGGGRAPGRAGGIGRIRRARAVARWRRVPGAGTAGRARRRRHREQPAAPRVARP